MESKTSHTENLKDKTVRLQVLAKMEGGIRSVFERRNIAESQRKADPSKIAESEFLAERTCQF